MDTQGFSTRLFVGQPDFLKIPSKTKAHLFQARRLERVAVSFSRRIFPTQGSNLHLCNSRWILFHWATWEAPNAHELPVYSLASLSLRLSPFVQHETEQNSETRAQNLASKSFLFYQCIERGCVLKQSAAMLDSPSCPHRCGSGITHMSFTAQKATPHTLSGAPDGPEESGAETGPPPPSSGPWRCEKPHYFCSQRIPVNHDHVCWPEVESETLFNHHSLFSTGSWFWWEAKQSVYS